MKEELLKRHRELKPEIRARLSDFRKVWRQGDRKIFGELCFCICTPQSKAVYCDKAVKELERSGVLFSGSVPEVRKRLKAVRFPNNKARFIVETRKRLSVGGKIMIKRHIDPADLFSTREWLVENILGLGLKEASHFLRNIGFGDRLAILDVHILKNMVRLGVIKERPKNTGRKIYYELEKKFRDLAAELGIPMAELDILLWARETGVVFK